MIQAPEDKSSIINTGKNVRYTLYFAYIKKIKNDIDIYTLPYISIVNWTNFEEKCHLLMTLQFGFFF